MENEKEFQSPIAVRPPKNPPGAPAKSGSRKPDDDPMDLNEFREPAIIKIQSAIRSLNARKRFDQAREDLPRNEELHIVWAKENMLFVALNDYLKGSYGFTEDVFDRPHKLPSDFTISQESQNHLDQIYHMTIGLCYQFAKDNSGFVDRYRDSDDSDKISDPNFIGRFVAIKLQGVVDYLNDLHHQAFYQTFNKLLKEIGYPKKFFDEKSISNIANNPNISHSIKEVEDEVSISFYSWMVKNQSDRVQSIPPNVLECSLSPKKFQFSVRTNVENALDDFFKNTNSSGIGIRHDLVSRIELEHRLFHEQDHALLEKGLDVGDGESCDQSFDSGGGLTHLGAGPSGSASTTPSSTPYKGVTFSYRNQIELAANNTPQKLADSSPFKIRNTKPVSDVDDQAVAASGQVTPSPQLSTKRAGSVGSLVKKFEGVSR